MTEMVQSFQNLTLLKISIEMNVNIVAYGAAILGVENEREVIWQPPHVHCDTHCGIFVTMATKCLTGLLANILVPSLAKFLADCSVMPMFRFPPFGTSSSFGLSGCEPRKESKMYYGVCTSAVSGYFMSLNLATTSGRLMSASNIFPAMWPKTNKMFVNHMKVDKGWDWLLRG